MNKEVIEKIKNAKSAIEFKELAVKNGYKLTDEEANNYFNMFHTEGKINDVELDNVAGGSQCRGTSTYSSDPPYYLITTLVNGCELFKHHSDPSYEGQECGKCKHIKRSGLVCYCTKRTYDNDPLNP